MNTTLKRSIVGVGFLAVMVGCLLVGPAFWTPVFSIILVGCMTEFFQITLGKKHRGAQIAALVVAATGFVLSIAIARGDLPLKWLTLNTVTVILIMLVMVFDHTDFKEYSYIFTALLYIGLPVALSPFMVYDNGAFDGTLMLSFFIVIWASDTGAYCLGMLLGQKIWPAKLCPTISPKKSWAGFWGGLLFALLAGCILVWTGLWPYPILHALILAALMHVAGVFGDLFESQWKRVCGVKDSGNIIPGHGGALDRFDSALFAIPAGVIYLVITGLL